VVRWRLNRRNGLGSQHSKPRPRRSTRSQRPNPPGESHQKGCPTLILAPPRLHRAAPRFPKKQTKPPPPFLPPKRIAKPLPTKRKQDSSSNHSFGSSSRLPSEILRRRLFCPTPSCARKLIFLHARTLRQIVPRSKSIPVPRDCPPSEACLGRRGSRRQ
jgi:hypothetical protein